VNAAAMGEIAYGKHGNVNSCFYVTVGTGVGGGVVVDGKPVTGILHPEAGHFKVPKHPEDKFEGNCPFHKNCIEGLTNTLAIAARFGMDKTDLASIPDSSPVWDYVAFYLAQLCVVAACVVSPHVIVLGGGVMQRALLFAKIRKYFVNELNGYLLVPKMIERVDQYIVPSIFNAPGGQTTAGAVGALHLAHLTLLSPPSSASKAAKTKQSKL